MDNVLKNILRSLRSGNLRIAYDYKDYINKRAMELYNSEKKLKKDELEDFKDIISIANITYNDTDRDLLPIEDGIYDLLLEKYKTYDPNFQVGAEVIGFDNRINSQYNAYTENQEKELIPALYFEEEKESAFMNDIRISPTMFMDARDFERHNINYIADNDASAISKRLHDTEHSHPELVGTLDKCKFVTNRDAELKGVLDDANVKTVERDFFADHIKRGIIDTTQEFDIVLELKYDGISVEADCTDIVESARSRGDTGIGKASDLTPILKGYRFPHREHGSKSIGVKFEAIMTNYDLYNFNIAKGTTYKNCRTAIIGLFASADAYKYKDYITLVPLAVEREVYENECKSNRLLEIEFLNKYFVTKGCPLRYSVARGNYITNLAWIKMFVEDAESSRAWLPFMYDGVVLSYLDESIRQKLGRENYINKYSMAIKFNPLKKQTIFRGYTYTVGQDGSITPMIHYDPIEFYGTIHNKSSGHSYARFRELALHIGDMLSVEYVNDVMPYVTKPVNDFNIHNCMNTPLVEFITQCPVCGTQLIYSDKSAKCPNQNCGGRALARMVSSCSKLGLVGFAEATLSALDETHLSGLLEIFEDNFDTEEWLYEHGFGPVEIENMKSEVKKMLETPMYDTKILGSIGFTGISTKTFELILARVPFDQFMYGLTTTNKSERTMLIDILRSIKGIGMSTIDTILTEFDYFREDIEYLASHANMVHYIPTTGKKIRATGFRDKEFFQYLNSIGFDADDNASLTKDTDILLVPSEGFTSSKTARAESLNILIVPVNDFRSNMEKYM